jgi:hypothetical protein
MATLQAAYNRVMVVRRAPYEEGIGGDKKRIDPAFHSDLECILDLAFSADVDEMGLQPGRLCRRQDVCAVSTADGGFAALYVAKGAL